MLAVFLPLIRRLDYQSVLHPVLADLVGAVQIVNDDGSTAELDLLAAHRCAILAFVSGVGIPCAGDVPAFFLGRSPADLGTGLLVHSRAIGNSAMLVVDRSTGRAVRVNVVTGVLPHDKELTALRGKVINHKAVSRSAATRG